MASLPRARARVHWSVVILLVGLSIAGTWYFRSKPGRSRRAASATPQAKEPEPTAVRVDVARPSVGGLQRISDQVGSVTADESVELLAKAAGFVKIRRVDIGDVVKAGDLLAEIDAPERQKDVEQGEALVLQAKANVDQMKSKIKVSEADADAAASKVQHAEAEASKCHAECIYQKSRLARTKELFNLRSVEEKLVFERENETRASEAACAAAEAGIAAAKAMKIASAAKIGEARSDLEAAEAKVKVEKAMLERARVLLGFTRITAPCNGVVTERNTDVGDYITSADQGGKTPLFVVMKIDTMRVVVAVPDRDAPFVEVGNPATVEFQALPGVTVQAKVSRTSRSQVSRSRTMRVEVDISNKKNQFIAGMYGNVKIVMRPAAKALTIPTAALVGKPDGGYGNVYVVKDGKARLTKVRIEGDDGRKMEISGGLKASDLVVVGSSGTIADSSDVIVPDQLAAMAKADAEDAKQEEEMPE